MDRGAWCTTVHKVAKIRTQLKVVYLYTGICTHDEEELLIIVNTLFIWSPKAYYMEDETNTETAWDVIGIQCGCSK